MKRIRALVGLLLAAGVGGTRPAGAEAAGSLRCTVELDSLHELAQRLELRTPGWRWLAVDRRLGLDPVYQAWGVSGPFIALGPLEPRGLLRELANPLGYSPGSETLAEESGFALAGSLAGTPLRGLWLEPFPDRFGLFALRSPPRAAAVPAGPNQAGGVLRLPLAPGLDVEALGLFTRQAGPLDSDPDDRWFRDPFAAGPLAHFGGRLALRQARDGTGVSMLGSGAVSGGGRVRPGLFLQLQLGAASPVLTALVLCGACTAEYFTPSGEGGRDSLLFAARMQWNAAAGCRLAGSWSRRVGRPEPGPAACLPVADSVGASVEWTGGLKSGMRGSLKVASDASLGWEPAGRGPLKCGGGLEAGLQTARAAAVLELSGRWDEEAATGRLRTVLRGRLAGFSLELGLVGQDKARPAPCGRLEAVRGSSVLWIEARAEPEGSWQASLGWTAVQLLPKSPTRRTSRSR